MVRKRDAWTRAQDQFRIRRNRRPAPKVGWVLAELAALTGQPRRTIRYYVEQGLLGRPEFRGTATRYQRSHLLRLLAIQRLKSEGVPSLSAIKQRIDAAGEAELLAAVSARPPSTAVATALGLPVSGAAPVSTQSASMVSGGAAAAPEEAELTGEAWRRVLLLPGLELLLAEDASPAVRQVARQIQVYCARR
jgi:DNA-binding transcriptional MerR regulator